MPFHRLLLGYPRSHRQRRRACGRAYLYLFFLREKINSFVLKKLFFQDNGPFWEVPTGRRDGRVSNATEALTLPAFSANISSLKSQFGTLGLSARDLVLLSGTLLLSRSLLPFVVDFLDDFIQARTRSETRTASRSRGGCIIFPAEEIARTPTRLWITNTCRD